MGDRWTVAENIVGKLLRERYPEAVAAFVGGSFARGDATPTSDIDLVVLFPSLDHAWRETLTADGTTVEAFCHDPGTLKYFFTKCDLPTGLVPLAQMIVEGRNLMLGTAIAESARTLARKILDEGPPALTAEQINMRRYEITTALEDLTDANHPQEILAVGVSLYQTLADTALRGARQWSGTGKYLPRKLRQFDADLASDLDNAIRLLATDSDRGKREFHNLVGRVLKPYGGQLLIGHRLDAPPDWRA